ncbi:MAG: hypothetical protein WBJ81_06510 [Rickettsiales bacterium]
MARSQKQIDREKAANKQSNKFEVMVVRYKEDVSWLKEKFPTDKVTLYNKGANDINVSSNVNIVNMDNIGYLGGVILDHIILRMKANSLADRTLFLQGNPFDSSYKFDNFDDYKTVKKPTGTPKSNECKNIIAKCKPSTIAKQQKGLDKVKWEESQNYKDFKSMSGLSFSEFADKFVCQYNKDAVLHISFGSQFALDKNTILDHDLSYYEDLRSNFNDRFPLEDHYFERLADLIFGNCQEYN